jgi:mitochondrial-processing peptidase subunit alpha
VLTRATALAGLFGCYGAAPPDYAGALIETLALQLSALLSRPVTPAELSRARNQLASSVAMNLETRALLCEDIGRQVLNHGKRLDPAELLRRIQAVSAADVQRVMRAALSHPPALAIVGDINAASAPTYDTLRQFFETATSTQPSSVSAAPGGRRA